MTKVVDGLLRDSIGSYTSNLQKNGDDGNVFHFQYKALKRQAVLPKVGEIANTPYGTGEVQSVKYWNDFTDSEKLKIRDRAEKALDDIQTYFEYTVRFKEGDTATFDFSGYNGSF